MGRTTTQHTHLHTSYIFNIMRHLKYLLDIISSSTPFLIFFCKIISLLERAGDLFTAVLVCFFVLNYIE